MRSVFADAYNHDTYAGTYDKNVADESNPIRKGYRAALDWIGTVVGHCSLILDLGTGTGNTIAVLPTNAKVVAVDVSKNMLQIAQKKLAGRDIEYIQSDILEYMETPSRRCFDGIVSSYAIHHLTEPEKAWLLSRTKELLLAGCKAVFVDLMYEDAGHRQALIEQYRQENADVAESIEEEIFWDIQKTRRLLEVLGFGYSMKRFSELSWGIMLTKT
jgi:putative AdoMet-dependent methyltransferase